MKALLFLILTCALAACARAEQPVEPVASAVTTAATLAPVVSDPSPAAITATSGPPEATELPPTATPTPTEMPIAAATPTAADGQPAAVVYGRTSDGAFFHGSPDAPVTLTDYSDFL